MWCNECYQQHAFKSIRSQGVEFHENLPDTEMLDCGKRTLLIIDDLMSETDGRVTDIFTKGSHHKDISVIYISQNLYNKNRRTER